MERQEPGFDKDMTDVEFRRRSYRGSVAAPYLSPGTRMTDCSH